MNNLSFYYCIFVIAFMLARGYADESEPQAGSLHPLRDEVISATDVVIGKFSAVKASDAVSMTGTVYHGQITVLEALKGDAAGSFDVGFSVIRGGKNKEAEPNLDDTYIVVLTDHHEIRKLLPATEDNLAKVKALVAASPVTKPK